MPYNYNPDDLSDEYNYMQYIGNPNSISGSNGGNIFGYNDPNNILGEYSQGSGGNSGGFNMMDYLGKGTTAATGMINPLISTGLNLASGIFKALKGTPGNVKNAQKIRAATAKQLQGQLGTDVFNMGDYINRNRALMLPRAKQYGAIADKRFGFDQGRGQAYFFNQINDQEMQNLYDLGLANDKAKNARDLQIRMGLLGFQG